MTGCIDIDIYSYEIKISMFLLLQMQFILRGAWKSSLIFKVTHMHPRGFAQRKLGGSPLSVGFVLKFHGNENE